MERRDFLVGSLVGVGAGAGVTALAQTLRDEAEAANAKTSEPAEVASEATAVEPAPPPADPSTPPNVAPGPPDGRRLSYAQQGEDLIILNLLEMLGRPKPSYLDVGAYHPTVSSNTYLLYAVGGRGVLVEPNPFMAAMARKVRPEDTMLAVGVGLDDTREADYYVMRDRPQLNTFSKAQVDRYIEKSGPGILEKTLKLPLVPINEILEEHFETPPDLLSLDVEGLDIEILKTMDFERYRPAVMCIETLVFGTKQIVGEINDLMRARGYVIRGATFVNTIFVDGKLLGTGRVSL